MKTTESYFFHFFKDTPGVLPVPATASEIVHAQDIAEWIARLEKEIKSREDEIRLLKEGCQHLACSDRIEEPYNIRKCLGCGAVSYV